MIQSTVHSSSVSPHAPFFLSQSDTMVPCGLPALTGKELLFTVGQKTHS